ncbi:F-box domain protein [Apiospora arundinis]
MPPKVKFKEANTAQNSQGKSSDMSKNGLSKRLRFSRATTARSPVAAQQAVLSTWELVELILEYMDDVRDLLFFQRVSATWRDVVRGSVLLQERLFLRPATPTDKDEGTWRGSGEETGMIELNPLLTRAFPHFSHLNRLEPFPLWARWNKELILLEEDAEYEGVPSRNGRRNSNSGDNNSNRKRKKKKNRAVAALTRRGPSWRAMLVSQPPPNRLKYGPVVVARSSSNKGHAHDRSDLDPALRMGALYDLAHYAQWRTGVFKVGWQLYDQPFDDEGHMMLPRERWDHRKPGKYRDVSTTTLLSRGFLDVCVWENSWVREQTASSCSSSSASSKEREGLG